jgi:hypothetical protein
VLELRRIELGGDLHEEFLCDESCRVRQPRQPVSIDHRVVMARPATLRWGPTCTITGFGGLLEGESVKDPEDR